MTFLDLNFGMGPYFFNLMYDINQSSYVNTYIVLKYF